MLFNIWGKNNSQWHVQPWFPLSLTEMSLCVFVKLWMLLVCVEEADVGGLALRFYGFSLKHYQCESLGQHVGQRHFVTLSCTEALAEWYQGVFGGNFGLIPAGPPLVAAVCGIVLWNMPRHRCAWNVIQQNLDLNQLVLLWCRHILKAVNRSQWAGKQKTEALGSSAAVRPVACEMTLLHTHEGWRHLSILTAILPSAFLCSGLKWRQWHTAIKGVASTAFGKWLIWISGTKQKVQFQTCSLILSIIMLQVYLLAHVFGKEQPVVG